MGGTTPSGAVDGQRLLVLRWRLATALLVGGALAGYAKAMLTLPLGGAVEGPLLGGSLAALMGWFVVRRGPEMADRWYLVAGMGGVVVLTVATYFEGLDGTVAADNVLFYVWPVLFFGAFLPRRWMWVLVAESSAAYCLLLGLLVAGPLAVGRAVTTIATLVGSGWLVAELRDHADAALRTSHEQSVTDPLTGLLNRRGLADALGRLPVHPWASVSLLLCDLDHFKRVNDVHGHAAGDAALRRVAEVLRRTCGDSALVARQGGEEFVVVVTLPPEHATQLAEAVRQAVRADSSPAAEPLTISIGVASSPPNELGLAPLLRAADAALYLAKARGRDRVVTAEGLPAADLVS